MSKKSTNGDRVFGIFFVVTENGMEKTAVNTKLIQETQDKLLEEIKEKNANGELKIPKEIKKELLKKFQSLLDKA